MHMKVLVKQKQLEGQTPQTNEFTSVPNPKIDVEYLIKYKGYIAADDYLKEHGLFKANGLGSSDVTKD